MLTLITTLVLGASNPPVLGWSNHQGAFLGADAIRAGAAVSVDTALKSHISLAGRNTVVFAQDQLSVEDITKYGGVYGVGESAFSNIKSAMDTAEESLVLPAVSGSLVKSLGGNVVTMTAADLENGAAAATAALKGDKATVIVFQLPAVAGAADVAAALKSNDALVGKTFQLLTAADNSIVALLTADAESPLTGATRQAALALPDVDEVEIAEEAEVAYTMRSRRDVASVSAANRAASAAVHECSKWPQQVREYPNPRHPQQQGGKTCKPGHIFGVKQKTEYFGTPILMGITVSILLVSVVMSGVFCLMLLQTNSKYPSVDDAAIIVSTANE